MTVATTPAGQGTGGSLVWRAAEGREGTLSFVSDPADPVTDVFAARTGAHDYRDLARRTDLLTFESAPLAEDVRVVGAIGAELFFSCDAPDTDLWVKLYDVAPDGTAFNLMSPGLDVQRASLRNGGPGRELLAPGRVYKLRFDGLFTGNVFRRGHRIRVCLTGAFMPHFSRNLHTGALETVSSSMRKAKVTIHTGSSALSRIVLPVVP
jgi:putative CocE/NonD family hydrolase